jgi:putative protease
MRDYKKIELLSPAGSYEGFEAVLGAGADAVYVGGAAFGARAYAKNFEEEELLRAIDTAHIHGRKLYLTVNTLLKNDELKEQLYQYVLPYYKAGLDAVLVQDFGVLRFLRRNFPDLPLHASTQMTVTGPEGMHFLEKEGVTRVVGARELSLKELRAMHESSPLEIEAFIHGALCYSYSGQCLMSSMIGGRSGNRGRCAQPCRLPYQSASGDGSFDKRKDLCPLSLKDMCTIDLLPELLDAGVVSLKIEGRMKQPQYAAGVTGIYRKYLDRLLADGPEAYHVKEADRRFLLDLFNRGGSCEGYLREHNGPSMLSLANEKKTGDISLELKKPQRKINGSLMLYPGSPAYLTVESGGVSVTAACGEVQTAQKQPMEESRIRQQMEKLGGTGYVWESLTIEMDSDIFIAVSTLNQLRREALLELQEALLIPYRRPDPEAATDMQKPIAQDAEARDGHGEIPLYVSCETMDQARAARENRKVRGLYLPFSIMETFMAEGAADSLELYLALPHMVRGTAPEGYFEQARKWLDAGMKGFLVRSLESYAYLAEQNFTSYVVTDSSLYTWNEEAEAFFANQGILRNTAPLELNEKELRQRDNQGSEFLLYGYLPLMLSAQCVRKNLYGCDARESYARLRDRYGAVFVSSCYCHPWKMQTTKKHEFCYNIVYNSLPYGLLKEKKQVERLAFSSYRISLTMEDARESAQILKAFVDVYYHGKEPAKLELTRGHFRRGAE